MTTSQDALKESYDPADIVKFEDDDPEKAVNWPSRVKWANVIILAAMSFIVSLASSMTVPGVSQAMREFHSDSSTLGSLVVSIFSLGLACGPLIVAPLSEIYGRLIPYHVSNILFIIFSVGCAVSPNLASLVVFRMLAGMMAASVLNIGGATVADLFVPEERGNAMAAWTYGPLLGPAIGPVAGGFLSQAKGWRWVFWVITLAATVTAVLFSLIMRESYPPVLLEQKVKRLRRETGNERLRSEMKVDLEPKELFKRALRRPLFLLFRSPIVFLSSVFIAVVYGYLYLLYTTMALVFKAQYGFSEGFQGLAYLGIGVGFLIGNAFFGLMSDRVLKTKSASHTDELKPEYRLPVMIPGAFCIPASFFIYGWTAQLKTFWLIPILGMSLMGFGVNTTFMSIQIYLVDSFTLYAASALAATTILRSLVGALLPLAGPPLYEKLGLGWGNSTLGFIAMTLIPVPFLFFRFGESIRRNSRFQLDL
ncbi:hypothetical protein PRK78_000282 [Emydomyces testavorans]|uniref:Major facilitator superfamily (MFS) profile domain-containing protein n=1 Tax=Emydomyces testavorans TaxID=2070801 RepID=A0AAF0DAE4_9EURO|nr:hypothetical protein PRK78_000282 [Emydomyces testavorans]